MNLKNFKVAMLLLLPAMLCGQFTGQGFNPATGGGLVDSTRMLAGSDTIIVYFQDGTEVGRDTIRAAGGGVVVETDKIAKRRGSAYWYPPGAVKLGKIIDPPGGLSPARLAAGSVVDMQQVIPSWPYRLAMYASTDHSGGGSAGARLYVANDPKGPWLNFDDVRADFTAAGFTDPGPNPIFQHPTNTADRGEYFTVWPTPDGTISIGGHSFGLGGGFGSDPAADGQSQWTARSTDGLNFTYDKHIDFPIEAHNHTGSYGMVEKWKGTYVSNHTMTALPLISYAQSHSLDGRYWKADDRRIFHRDFTHWGDDTLTIVKAAFHVDERGQEWAIGLIRKDPAIGGGAQAQEPQICIFPVSPDGRRMVGMPYQLIDKGAANTFDENGPQGRPQVFRDIYGPEPERIYIYYAARTDEDVQAIGVAYVDPDISSTTPAFAVDSFYAEYLTIDREGLPQASGWGGWHDLTKATPDRATLPVDVWKTNLGPNTDGSITVNPAESIVMATGTGSGKDVVMMSRGIDLVNSCADVMIEMRGIRSPAYDATMLFQLGLYDEANDNTIFQYLDRTDYDQAEFRYWDGTSTLSIEIPRWGYWAYSQLQRDKSNLAVRLASVRSQDNTTREWFAEVWAGDQIVVKKHLPGFAPAAAYPYCRLISLTSGSSTLVVEKYQVRYSTTAKYVAGNSTVLNGPKRDLEDAFRTGPGTPEGVVTAPVGTIWLRQDGGANTTIYVKETGTGNTGWVAK